MLCAEKGESIQTAIVMVVLLVIMLAMGVSISISVGLSSAVAMLCIATAKNNKNFFRHRNIAPQSKFFLRNSSILSNGITARLSYRSVWTAPGIARNSLLAAYLLLRTISLKASFPK